ncbi:hypothetical protein A3D07_02650 [Candidatus Curtissbacteria bacterium RIFCSPHIGHO2_02_FULL_42_15]|uniref:Uncharacterized protein n=1 Tax=Candidatus Curtissbacteria bacterium RIFCSPHIGHO2_02_FULL_42_15 TaxID=1797716 RepID=A0A1F5GJ06_9BACT|nr:MAG: hypothetical protein A3D07_02650 [Candidatus Curtissbacteria bacterium RIFCSPHIGHO2_02_FULL_42_15]
MQNVENQKVSFRSLVDGIFAADQLARIRDDIRTISAMAFKVGAGSLSSQIKTKVGSSMYLYILSLEKENRLPAAASLGYFLSELAGFLEGIDKITLTVAFEPSLDFQKEIALWLEKNLGRKVVCDFAVDEGIIGGLVIEYHGKYKDFSKAQEIESRMRSV